MSNNALVAAMENKVFNMYIIYREDVGEAQNITKYIKDNNRLATWFAVHPQIVELNKKMIVNTELYIRHLDNILEELPKSCFRLPSLDDIDDIQG
jgi:hypothetical protein